MAYPGEREHATYQAWSIEQQSNGLDGSREAYKKYREEQKKKKEGKNEKDSPLTLNFENSDHR